MGKYFVYILESELNGSYYVGQTEDLQKRLEEHNKGRVQSTKYSRPWKLVHYEEYESRSESVKREREIKSYKKRAYIEKIIRYRNVAQPG
jgi:putative endonuclease